MTCCKFQPSVIIDAAIYVYFVAWPAGGLHIRLPEHDTAAQIATYDHTEYLHSVDLMHESEQTSEQTIPINNDILEQALRMPLFSETGDDMNVSQHAKAASATGGIAILHYHKTGAAYTAQLMDVLASRKWKQLENGTFPFQSEVDTLPGEWIRVTRPGKAIRISNNTRIVHFYRNPVKLLLSGYRFHKNTPEPWESDPRSCADPSHFENDVFQACGCNCSYGGLLNAAGNENTGLVIEALWERPHLDQMVGVLQGHANNENALHLTVEHLAASYDATVRCMLKFLGMAEAAQVGKYTRELGSLDVGKHPNSHVTNNRYNNTGLQRFLETRAVWGPQLSRLRAHERLIFNRQAELYGCPVV